MRDTIMEKLQIFGGGLAGLFTAFFALKKQIRFEIYEASGEIGGNCKTFSHGDFRFDSGAHRFHDRDPEMTRELLQLMDGDIHEIFAPSYIFYRGKLIHFPITPINLFSKLPPGVLAQSLYRFFFNKYRNRKIHNFREYSYQKYGQVIANLFLTNYSEKTWGLPADRLSAEIAATRLKALNLQSIIMELLYPRRKPKHLEGAFFYPRKGFGQIANRLAEHIGREHLRLNSRITRIFHAGNRISGFEVNGCERVEAREVVSSMPLSLFILSMEPEPPKEILRMASSIDFRHLKLVCFFLGKKTLNNAATMYFPDSKFLFTRAYEPRNRSRFMAPARKTSLIMEVPYSLGDPVDRLSDEELLFHVKPQVLGTGLFQEKEILDMTVKTLPFAYPVLEKDFRTRVAKIKNYCDRFENLHHTGRNGKFVYSWVHNMMQYGRDVVEQIMA